MECEAAGRAWAGLARNMDVSYSISSGKEVPFTNSLLVQFKTDLLYYDLNRFISNT